MMRIGELWRRLRFWLHRAEFSADLDEEMRLHMELRAAQLRETEHLTSEGAVVTARRRFGNATRLKEVSRELWSVRWAEDCLQDMKLTVRQLRNTPGFTAVAVGSLALGIGANTAIFTLINAVLLTSLPVRDPCGLLLLGNARGDGVGTAQSGSFFAYSVDLYRHLKNVDAFDGLAAVQSSDQTRVSVRRAAWAAAQPARAKLVSGNYFDVLGVHALVGRMLEPSDDSVSAPPVVVISYQYWKDALNGNPSVIGTPLEMSGVSLVIAGIAPPEFFGEKLQPDPPSLWIPLSVERQLDPQHPLIDSPDDHWLYLLGRLKPTVSVAQAEARLTAALKNWRFAREGSALSDEGRRVILGNYVELTSAGGGVAGMKRGYSRTLQLLLAISMTVLLIACANIAALLLARGSARRVERFVRLALGGGRGRLVRQSLAESLTLGLAGGALGLSVAVGGTKLLIATVFRGAQYVPIHVAPDLRVLAFTLVLSAGAAVLFGLLPTIRMSAEIARGMKPAGPAGHGPRAVRRRLGLGAGLIIGEAALSVVVLAAASGFVRSLVNLTRQQFGFDREHVLTLNIDPARAGYGHNRLGPLYQRIDTRLNALPGVKGASLSTYSPFDECCDSFTITVDGYTPKSGERVNARLDRASPRYFETIGTRVLRGRSFDDHDTPESSPVAVVSDAFVRRYFPGQDPIGRRFGFGGAASHARDLEIIGVVENAKYDDVRETAQPMAFLPMLQEGPGAIGFLTEADFARVIEVRSAARPAALVAQVRAALVEIDPNLSVLQVATVSDQLDAMLSRDNVIAGLSTFLGLLGLALTGVGLYGLTAFSVQRRSSEIGLRMALGARRSTVMRMVIGTVLAQGVLGVLLGVPAALITGRLVASQLYGVSPTDPRNAALAVLGLVACMTLAGFVPAHHASRIDPIRALRNDG
jgi:macrolide transport system ATP-binding/permease protein